MFHPEANLYPQQLAANTGTDVKRNLEAHGQRQCNKTKYCLKLDCLVPDRHTAMLLFQQPVCPFCQCSDLLGWFYPALQERALETLYCTALNPYQSVQCAETFSWPYEVLFLVIQLSFIVEIEDH